MTVDRKEKVAALLEAATYRPILGSTIVGLSLLTALLEGIGVGFLLPIITFAQSSSVTDADGSVRPFAQVYEFVGIPLTLETLVAGVAIVMMFRFGVSFLVSWLRAILNIGYQRTLRQRLFEALAFAPIDYIDQAGSDELLNSLLTEANRAGNIVSGVFDFFETTLRGLIYLGIAAILSPVMTVVAIVGLGTSTLFVRFVLEPAYTVGDDIADANERLQTISQTGLQGMRDVRLFNMRDELLGQMRDALGEFFDAGVKLKRNKAALSSLNRLTNALVLFGLIYVGIQFTSLSLGEMGVFLFAMFRLAPTVTQINNMVYSIDGQLPHLVRVHSRLQEIESGPQPATNGARAIDSVDRVEFEDISFSYGDSEQVLRGLSFAVERGEHVAFVGQSGAGKSTIVSLLSRLQTPDSGDIYADSTLIDEFDVEQWRERIAVVRQDPYVFDGTLRENLTVGNRDATTEEIERACAVAQVTEFLSELPQGYETDLGEDGVRLSGGQKQRVAIARALLKDADVLILDEATSDLDSNIERDVHTGLAEMDSEYAIVSIAHRLSPVSDADRIYTLVAGSVSEIGTHEELLEKDGMYADLYATQ